MIRIYYVVANKHAGTLLVVVVVRVVCEHAPVGGFPIHVQSVRRLSV